MNVTIPDQVINLSDPAFLRKQCETLYVNYDYSFYIIINFVLIMALFINHKTNLTKRFDFAPERFQNIISIVFLIFNTCMFAFQFFVKPIEIMLMGG